MTDGEWVAGLEAGAKLRFLVRLSCELTIVGRDSYEVGGEGLTNPRHLRRINEIQHRVSACLDQLLSGCCPKGFDTSIAEWVLGERDPALNSLLKYGWRQAKLHIEPYLTVN